jgi:L-iditol 2-dehydrogenase
MKKIILTGIKKFEIVDGIIPLIENADDVLLKVEAVGVCGSDIHYYRDGRIGDQVIEFPFTIGHEFVARVSNVGDNVAHVKIGDLVAVDPLVYCQKCSQCLVGRFNTCLEQNSIGCPGQFEGCLSEFIVVPERNCFIIPPGITLELAALVEPLSIGYYAAQFHKKYSGIKNIAILGAGPIGTSVMLFLQLFGMENILVTDKLDYRLAIAEEHGAKHVVNPEYEDVAGYLTKNNIEHFDAVYECCGQQEALDQAIDILKPGGILFIVGIPEPDRISFDISKIRRKEITIQNVRRQNESMQPVIDLIANENISAEFMITHKMNFIKTQDAFEIVAGYKENVLKALITF